MCLVPRSANQCYGYTVPEHVPVNICRHIRYIHKITNMFMDQLVLTANSTIVEQLNSIVIEALHVPQQCADKET